MIHLHTTISSPLRTREKLILPSDVQVEPPSRLSLKEQGKQNLLNVW